MMHSRKEDYKNLANKIEIRYLRFQVEQRPIDKEYVGLMQNDEKVEAVEIYNKMCWMNLQDKLYIIKIAGP